MIIYHYDRDTKEFLFQEDAVPNPVRKGSYLVPAFATQKRLPKEKEGYVRCFENDNWIYREVPKVEEKEEEKPESITLTYKEKRIMEYPPIGDMIDAFVKADQGDRTDLDRLIAEINAVKAKYPKDE